MTKAALTGAQGFLGWHTRAALLGVGIESVPIGCGTKFDRDAAVAALNGAERAIHIAGVNRAEDQEITDGNIGFAEQFADALRATDTPPPTVVFANSTQVGNGSVYGEAKARAAEIVASAASEMGVEFLDVKLPNLFGEHGKPFYNAVTATFCHLVAHGESPTVDQDKELTLLHAQNAADLLTGIVAASEQSSLEQTETVSGILRRIQGYAVHYQRGDIPDLGDDFDRDLFNTYRSYTFPEHALIPLIRHEDARGSFFEMIRSFGGESQSSFSTTVPGVTRGNHYHRRKIERFTVLQGNAHIGLRKLFTDEVVEFEVSGDVPTSIDMPTMWSHNITNIGSEVLFTSFWVNEVYDPDNPDTIAEAV